MIFTPTVGNWYLVKYPKKDINNNFSYQQNPLILKCEYFTDRDHFVARSYDTKDPGTGELSLSINWDDEAEIREINPLDYLDVIRPTPLEVIAMRNKYDD